MYLYTFVLMYLCTYVIDVEVIGKIVSLYMKKLLGLRSPT